MPIVPSNLQSRKRERTCRYLWRPWRAKLSPLTWSLRTRSTMSRPRFKIRREFHQINNVWSSPESNWKMDALWATTTSRRNLLFTLFFVCEEAYTILLWPSWLRATTATRLYAASAMHAFHHVPQIAERGNVDILHNYDPRKSSNKLVTYGNLYLLQLGVIRIYSYCCSFV